MGLLGCAIGLRFGFANDGLLNAIGCGEFGSFVGASVVGILVGIDVLRIVGFGVSCSVVGKSVGLRVGIDVTLMVGVTVGAKVGSDKSRHVDDADVSSWHVHSVSSFSKEVN